MFKISPVIILVLGAGIALSPTIENKVLAASSVEQLSQPQAEIQLKQSAIYYDKYTLVPLGELLTAFGASVEWQANTKTVIARKGETLLEVTIGASHAFVNKEKVTLDLPAVLLKGKTYAPIGLLSDTFGSHLSWNPYTNKVAILPQTSQTEFSEEERAFTIERAVDEAKLHSDVLDRAKQEIMKQELRYQEAEADSDQRPALKLAYEMAKKMEDVANDQTALLVKQTYQDIYVKQRAQKVNAIAYGIAFNQAEIANARSQIGRISRDQLNTTNEAMERAFRNLRQAKAELQKSRVKLNGLLGKPGDFNHELVDQPRYSVAVHKSKADLDAHIRAMSDKSPRLWQLKEQVKIEQRKNDLSADLKEIAVKNAEAALASNKASFAETIKSMNELLTLLEEQYQIAQRQLKSAEQELAVEITKYERGWVTLLDVMKKQLHAEQSRLELDRLMIQLDQAKSKWEKPWL
ncbi:hypothetical protein BEP19_13270 [Ammoniphilus oxalaticus]|uniref:Copper amine oxidase-like N-terminal domain-containing protein n=1 Tax=Ammoniphilus oxalaticus TaxID=66863 RepID=A0A419SH92_9BACL|nr:copper amine oxidase N-terminal domain-containing protein [Ammoniphilus oxalaticus]RKD23181.1 hypothetical protein BEP19_13270 [Ammoniphilus oxalaticus]